METMVRMRLAELLGLSLEFDTWHHQFIDEASRPCCYHNRLGWRVNTLLEALLTVALHYKNNFDVSQRDSWELSTRMTECEGLVSKVTSDRSEDDGKQNLAT
ncbi:hypothetical protein VNO77_35015 [Canavalia gladiata]|uniref:Uncharacterized protein n=1 Tax=Canavalia gladiata TaxID=3824 RepID=A0AAN9KI65_CANGL